MKKIRRACELFFIGIILIFSVFQSLFLWFAFLVSPDRGRLRDGWNHYLDTMKNAIREHQE